MQKLTGQATFIVNSLSTSVPVSAFEVHTRYGIDWQSCFFVAAYPGCFKVRVDDEVATGLAIQGTDHLCRKADDNKGLLAVVTGFEVFEVVDNYLETIILRPLGIGLGTKL